MSKAQKSTAFLNNDAKSTVEVENKDERPNDLLDYIVVTLCNEVSVVKAFKGGWMLTKLLNNDSRMTHDVDFSISQEEDYEEIKEVLTEIAEFFIAKGIISKYKLKETITSTCSGGIDFYDFNGQKMLGVDVGLHAIDWGTKQYEFDGLKFDGFEIERMLADKLISILSRKRFRRTKDLYDFYILVNNFDFDFIKLRQYIELRGGAEWDNIPFSDIVIEQYKKAWEKLILVSSIDPNTELEKPDFDLCLKKFYYIALPLKANGNYTVWLHGNGVLR